MKKLENKVAVITGGTAGIGFASARLFAQEGAKVVIAGSNPEKGEKAQATLQAEGYDVQFCRTDVSSEADVQALFAFTEKTYGRLDCLVCDAGVMLGVIPTTELDEAVFQRHLDVNTKGIYLCAKHAVPLIRRTAGTGTIVNVSSLTAHRPKPARVGYVASKAATVQMSKALAAEFAPEIRVNCVAPGLIDTDMAKTLPPEDIAKIVETFPAKRLGRAEEIAKGILFLSCDDSTYAYGTELCIDGGDSI